MNRTGLYDQLTCDMKEQLDLLEGLLKSDRVTGRQRIAKICVLSAYMKRRSNLCLLAESEKQTSTKELEFCISESLESMRLCNLFCSFESHCSGKTAAGELILLYDVVQQIFQQLLADAGAVMIWLRAENDSLFLKLQSDGRLCTEFPAMERWSAAGGSFSVSCGPGCCLADLAKGGRKRMTRPLFSLSYGMFGGILMVLYSLFLIQLGGLLLAKEKRRKKKTLFWSRWFLFLVTGIVLILLAAFSKQREMRLFSTVEQREREDQDQSAALMECSSGADTSWNCDCCAHMENARLSPYYTEPSGNQRKL